MKTVDKVFLLFLSLMMLGCQQLEHGGAKKKSAKAAAKVILHKVELKPETLLVNTIGTARAAKTATIYPKVGGEVLAMSFVAGDLVEKGQPLLELDSREEALALRNAQVQLADARKLLNRYQGITEPGAISASQLDVAKNAFSAATLNFESAQLALDDRVIRAPFGGFVGFSNIDPGARITTQTAVTRIDDRQTLYVDFSVPEEVFARIHAGLELNLVPFSAAGRSVPASVVAVDSYVDADLRHFTVRSLVDNSTDLYRPGMSFRVRLEFLGEPLPAVPEAAIIWGGDGAYLWAVKNDKATRVSLTVVSREEDLVLVDAPLSAGDMIIAEGVQKVREGSAVRYELAHQSAEPVAPTQFQQAAKGAKK